MVLKEDIIDILKNVKYPGYSRDIVSFGIIKDIQIHNNDVTIILSFKSNNEEIINQLNSIVKAEINAKANIDKLKVEIDVAETGPDFQSNKVEGIDKVVAIGSAKGGVGKSTVAINLAVELSKTNKVGFLDLDIYGPSLPLMIGERDTPQIVDQKLVPIEKHGIQLMSFGFLNQGDSPAIWRGPMVAKLTNQFFDNVNWRNLDILIIDLPPGTGDIQLTLAQKLALDGMLMVTTPQKIALEDVRKGSEMFKKVNVPILGVIENMSNFLLEGKLVFNDDNNITNGNIHIEGTDDVIKIDSDGGFEIPLSFFDGPGGLSESQRIGVPLIASIPLNSGLSLSIERGEPFMLSKKDNSVYKEFEKIASFIKKQFNLK